MGGVAVVHMDLMAKGGGEAVCMHVLEALQSNHDVTLLTLSEPNLDHLNEYFETDVKSLEVEQVGHIGPLLHQRYGGGYYILQNALLSRYARRQADKYDLMFSTINELGLPGDAIEYVHFPFDWNVGLNDELREQIFHPTVKENGVYEELCRGVAGITTATISESHLLANSSWTADAVDSAYGFRPDVLYPPIDTRWFEDVAWDARESGFVTIGRIERSKRIHKIIEIIDAVRAQDIDTHLHIIGPTVDSAYGNEIARMAERRPYILLEGELSRSALVEQVCHHQFGIHGKRHEHFGMAVAELAAGGTIPFVPATGGPSVIVDDRPELKYQSTQDAIEKIATVFSQPTLQSNLRSDPETIRHRFGRERFKERIAEMVDRVLAEE